MNPEKRKKIIILVVVCLLAYWVVKHFISNKTPALPPPTVIVQKPKFVSITDYVTQTGTMVAFNSVNLVARIEGYLQAIKFTDGSIVKKGTELFLIEPEPYLDKVKEAEASLVAQKAEYAYNTAEYERQKRMYKQNATSLNNVEIWLSKTEETKAEIDKAEANLDEAKINYSYTHVQAPFDGRIGRHLIDVGNLVGNGKATDLATIEQIDPIYVYFNLSELDLIKVRAAAHEHAIKPEDIKKIPVYVAMQNETGFPHEGKLDFVNTGLNASTGTMEFRALLSNKNYTLLPGLFVQVKVPISTPKQQLTLPDTAVLYDQVGPYVLVVAQNNAVVQKRVVVGTLEQGIRAIVKGLDAQDNVVVSGLQYAVPGNQVKPVQSEKK